MLRLENAKHVKQSSETASSSLVATSVAGRDQRTFAARNVCSVSEREILRERFLTVVLCTLSF